MSEIEKTNEDNLKLSLEKFITYINRTPNANELEPTPDGKAKTLPIDFVETTLDELFLGMWQTHSFTYTREFNEVIGSIILEVKNPITGEWIKRTGAASIVITQDKDATLETFNTTKKKNALDLTFPKLKAECVLNAARSLGNVFGRNLNRKKKDVYKPLFTISNSQKILE